MVVKVFGVAHDGVAVGHAELSEGACLAVLHDDLGHGGAEAAHDVVLFDRDDAARVRHRLDDRVSVDGLDGVHVDDAGTQTLPVENIRSAHGLEHPYAACDDGDVPAVTHGDGPADGVAVVLCLVDGRLEASPHADIHGPGPLHGRNHGVARLDAVGRNDHGHVRERPHDRQVFGAVMGGARLAERDARMSGDDLDVQVLVADVRAHLLGAAQRRERGEGGDHRPQAGLGEASRHAEHGVLGNAHIEEPIRKLLSETPDLGRAREVRSERHEIGISFSQLGEHLAVYFGLGQLVAVCNRPCHAFSHIPLLNRAEPGNRCPRSSGPRPSDRS